jgi:hypothetical protein
MSQPVNRACLQLQKPMMLSVPFDPQSQTAIVRTLAASGVAVALALRPLP